MVLKTEPDWPILSVKLETTTSPVLKNSKTSQNGKNRELGANPVLRRSGF